LAIGHKFGARVPYKDRVALDADDIARLYAAHARPLVAFFARRTFDPQTASELMAETFAEAVADRRSFRGDSAEAWLYGIARHQLSGWYRRAAVERKALRRLGLEPPHLTDVEYERVEQLAGLGALRERVAALLAELPDESRGALQLRIVEERPYPEVAARLGIAEPAARARVSRALRKLATELEDAMEAARDAA
jgi:RNA polymerase sigma-70 factor (ECF subfamily)